MTLFMQITETVLTHFRDDFLAKVHHKHQDVVKIKGNLLRDVFEVEDLSVWMVIVLCGW